MIVSWDQIEAYFHELRERVIQELGSAPSDYERTLAQGRLSLANELLSLKETLETMASAQKDVEEPRRLQPFARTESFRKIQLARIRPPALRREARPWH